jgi:hypothetical protein
MKGTTTTSWVCRALALELASVPLGFMVPVIVAGIGEVTCPPEMTATR